MNDSKALKLIVWLLTAIVIFTSIPATTIYAQVLQSSEVFRYTYHSDVSVIRSLPEYNFIATPAMATPFMQAPDMELFTVDTPNAPNEIHRLAVGDVFVFEPTDEKPAGLAGRVVSIHKEGNNVVITASYPELDDIYSEFEFIGEIDLMSGRYWYDVESWDRGIGVPLSQQDIVPFSPAFQGFMPEINVTSRFIQATVVNQTWNNVTIDGNLRWYLPRLNVNKCLLQDKNVVNLKIFL